MASTGTETTENCLELSTTERPRSTCATLTTVARQITQRELRNDSGEIMRGLDRGESFVITRNGVPVGELTPLHRRRFVSAEILVAAFADAPVVDAERFRRDIDRLASQAMSPRA